VNSNLFQNSKNPNIHIKGNYSYYSAYWDQGFERCVVRYLHDKPATPEKPIDQLHIGNFVCFGAECVIMMGGNQLHRPDWISTFPFDTRSFLPAGDTVIADGCWIGSRAMIMQGVKLGEGARGNRCCGHPRCTALCNCCWCSSQSY
jgi:chloramphenicol O-acetyltransferase type B